MENSISDFVVTPFNKPTSLPNSAGQLTGVRVLVVDDSEDNLFLLKSLLSRRGAEVVTCDNGLDGSAKALKNHFHVVLMDIQMPDVDGFDALKILKNSDYPRPVIALTAYSKASEKETIAQAGFAAHVSKPVETEQLIELIRSFANEQ